MISTKKGILYNAFGYKVLSEICLPELLQISQLDEDVDIMINYKDLSKQWVELNGRPNQFVVKKDFVIFHLSDVGIFSIQDGKSINIYPLKSANEDQIRLYVLGTCMGALLLQRRIFPLHGSAVAINGRAYAFIGDSGAGKSTLASVFLNRGYQLLSDDVIAVSLSPTENTPIVIPSYPQQKLWQKSLSNLGINNINYRPIYGRETKFCIPVSSQYYEKPLPLSGVYELIKSDTHSVEIKEINRLTRIQTLLKHTYRSYLVPRLGIQDWHFNSSIDIINHIGMFQLHRPNNMFTANELASITLENLI